MNKLIFKVMFAVLAFVTVGLGSYKMYGSYRAANMSEEELLMMENVLALSEPGQQSSGQKVRVRAAFIGHCYKHVVQSSPCGSTVGCNALYQSYSKGDAQYRCFNMSIERYKREENRWTLALAQDEECDGVVSDTKPVITGKNPVHDCSTCLFNQQ